MRKAECRHVVDCRGEPRGVADVAGAGGVNQSEKSRHRVGELVFVLAANRFRPDELHRQPHAARFQRLAHFPQLRGMKSQIFGIVALVRRRRDAGRRQRYAKLVGDLHLRRQRFQPLRPFGVVRPGKGQSPETGSDARRGEQAAHRVDPAIADQHLQLGDIDRNRVESARLRQLDRRHHRHSAQPNRAETQRFQHVLTPFAEGRREKWEGRTKSFPISPHFSLLTSHFSVRLPPSGLQAARSFAFPRRLCRRP